MEKLNTGAYYCSVIGSECPSADRYAFETHTKAPGGSAGMYDGEYDKICADFHNPESQEKFAAAGVNTTDACFFDNFVRGLQG